MPKQIDYCIDCGAVAEKRCLSCNDPLCIAHYKSQRGYCYDCLADIEEYLEVYEHDNVGRMARDDSGKKDKA